jgi:hypothetical protein
LDLENRRKAIEVLMSMTPEVPLAAFWQLWESIPGKYNTVVGEFTEEECFIAQGMMLALTSYPTIEVTDWAEDDR